MVLVTQPFESTLLKTGMRAHLKGFWYLCEAAALCETHAERELLLTKEIYPQIAKLHQTSAGNVERSIRHAIATLRSNNHLTNHEFLVCLRNANRERSECTFFERMV